MRRYLNILLLLTSAMFGQTGYIKSNEEVLFSFMTIKGKLATLAKDKNSAYIVYCYGTTDKVELQYPQIMDSSSWG